MGVPTFFAGYLRAIGIPLKMAFQEPTESVFMNTFGITRVAVVEKIDSF